MTSQKPYHSFVADLGFKPIFPRPEKHDPFALKELPLTRAQVGEIAYQRVTDLNSVTLGLAPRV